MRWICGRVCCAAGLFEETATVDSRLIEGCCPQIQRRGQDVGGCRSCVDGWWRKEAERNFGQAEARSVVV